MENNLVTLDFEALPENQGFARTVVAAYCAGLDPTIDEMTEIKTAVSEAVSNSIIHAYENRGKGRIHMEIKTVDKNKIYIQIIDYGKGIRDIEKAREPMYSTATDKEMSGMGFTVMESFSDKVLVKSEEGKGTSITLIKCLDVYYG